MTYKGLATVIKMPDGCPALRLDPKEKEVWARVLSSALERGKRVSISANVERRDRTDPQLRLYWAILTVLYFAVNGVKPNEDQKNLFHEDIKEVYANRRVSTLRPGIMVPVGFRDGDTQDASALIDGVFQELAQATISTRSDEMEARELWWKYWSLGGQKYKDEKDFRERAKLCAACARGGIIQLCHMESRGANPARKDDPANWLPLCPSCHGLQHQHGASEFLKLNPHLEKVWSR